MHFLIVVWTQGNVSFVHVDMRVNLSGLSHTRHVSDLVDVPDAPDNTE